MSPIIKEIAWQPFSRNDLPNKRTSADVLLCMEDGKILKVWVLEDRVGNIYFEEIGREGDSVFLLDIIYWAYIPKPM